MIETGGRKRRRLAAACLLSASFLLPGCRFVRTSSLHGSDAGSTDGTAGSTDPQARVAALWAPKILPYLQAKAAPFAALQAQLASDPEGALRDHGYKPKTTDAPPVYIVRIEGRIVAADTASMAGTVDVATGGAAKATLRLQIGPVIRGTALRDALPFVSFDQFANQIDYADFAKALDHRVRDTVVKNVPRTGLVGRSVSAVGVFRAPASGELPLVTPSALTLGTGNP